MTHRGAGSSLRFHGTLFLIALASGILVLSPSSALTCNPSTQYYAIVNLTLVCRQCSSCNLTAQYARSQCNGYNNTICANLSQPCSDNYYEAVSPTPTSDRVCARCSVCTVGSYSECGAHRDAVCASEDHLSTILFPHADFSSLFGVPKNQSLVDSFKTDLLSNLNGLGVNVTSIFKTDVAAGSVLARLHFESLSDSLACQSILQASNVSFTFNHVALVGMLTDDEASSSDSSWPKSRIVAVGVGCGVALLMILGLLIFCRRKCGGENDSKHRQRSHSYGEQELHSQKPADGPGPDVDPRRGGRRPSVSALSKQSSASSLSDYNENVDGGYLEVGFEQDPNVTLPGSMVPAFLRASTVRTNLSEFDLDCINAVFPDDEDVHAEESDPNIAVRPKGDYDFTIRRVTMSDHDLNGEHDDHMIAPLPSRSNSKHVVSDDTEFGFGFGEENDEDGASSPEPKVDERIQATFKKPVAGEKYQKQEAVPMRVNPMLKLLQAEHGGSQPSSQPGSRVTSLYDAHLDETVEVKRLHDHGHADIDVDKDHHRQDDSTTELLKSKSNEEEFEGFGDLAGDEPASFSSGPLSMVSVLVSELNESQSSLRWVACANELSGLISAQLKEAVTSASLEECIAAGIVPLLLKRLREAQSDTAVDSSFAFLFSLVAKSPQGAKELQETALADLTRMISSDPSVSDNAFETLSSLATRSPEASSQIFCETGALVSSLQLLGSRDTRIAPSTRHKAITFVSDIIIGSYPRPSWDVFAPGFELLVPLSSDSDPLVRVLVCKALTQIISEFFSSLAQVPVSIGPALIPLIKTTDEGKIVMDLILLLCASRTLSKAFSEAGLADALASLILQGDAAPPALVLSLKLIERLLSDFTAPTVASLKHTDGFVSFLSSLQASDTAFISHTAASLMERYFSPRKESLERKGSFEVFDQVVSASRSAGLTEPYRDDSLKKAKHKSLKDLRELSMDEDE